MSTPGTVRRVQDAVHGLMEFHGLEAAVIDLLRAPEIQRLRRIRQLGLGHLVFPAAEHSRLAHVLGAAHVAVRFARRLEAGTQELLTATLRPDELARSDLAIAALCHDLGHGPLSHTFEAEVIREFDRDSWTKSLGLEGMTLPASLKWHELVGLGILGWTEGQLHELLEEQEQGTAARIQRMLLGEHALAYLPRLLSSDVDVDRCDFLLRDAHQTGVGYGRFDLDWLISTAAVGVREDNQLVIGFDIRKAPRVVEQFIVARRALYETVYQHKAVKAAEGMVGLLLRRLRDVVEEHGWSFEQESLFAPYKKVMAGEALEPHEVLGLDDYSLWVLIMNVANRSGLDTTAEDLAARIVHRDLFKPVRVAGRQITNFLGTRGREALHPIVARHCPGEPSYYIHVDNPGLSTLTSARETEVYFIAHGGSGLGSATVAREHPEIQALFNPSEEGETRMFVPREAVDDVTSVLRA